jgi:hypothetical protein
MENIIMQVEIFDVWHKGVCVTIKIDYVKKDISLVDREGSDYVGKLWLFKNRGLEYMQGWIDITEAMEKAIRIGEERLKARVEKDAEDFENSVIEEFTAKQNA